MRELESGTQLASRYSLVRKLGAGGGAETWLASDKLTRASVALKIQHDESMSAAALRREWQLSIRLVHPHIVRVFEFHDTAGGYGAFYTMQYVEGSDIALLTAAPLEHSLGPVGLVADALSYAHKRGVVHRDVKASNVLLDANGAPFLSDFGVASVDGETIGGGSLIAASPQQLAGEAPQSSDDIFALGGLIYELVSGRSAYPSNETAAAIREHVPPPLAAANGGDVPVAIQNLVAAMLDKDAASRPDAAAVVAALRDAGFPPRPAPASYVSAVRAIGDEVIASETTIHSAKRPAARSAAPAARDSSGITPRTLAISLAVLLAVLLAVVFLLPRTVSVDEQDSTAATPAPETGEPAAAAETPADTLPERDQRVQAQAATDAILGRLLSRMRTLEGRGVQRWGGAPFKRAQEAYDAGDAAYLDNDYATAGEQYQRAFEELEPLLGQVEKIFQSTMADAEAALENGDTVDALRLYELAVAISPSNGPALAGLARAKNLDEVLTLTEQGIQLERRLELDAALANFERAIELDPEWEVAKTGLQRVREAINQREFDQRMTEGLNALAASDYLGARAAFRVAQELKPGSPEPVDGLLQVDQAIRLGRIASLEARAAELGKGEQWQAAEETYQQILELDPNLAFAQDGLRQSREMIALHRQLDDYIDNPDSLSAPRTMQTATNLVVSITRMEAIGPRLAEQRDELSRLLKRAATPLKVQLVSDNATEVSIYKVGKLGNFNQTELSLRPGTYVAVGVRPGYRDVRLEFRVAPEDEMEPVVIRCEERI